MQFRRQSNRVGLGTFPLTKLSKDAAKDIVGKFVGYGGYYIDTAPLYGFGDIENLLGEVLSEFNRDNFFIISKCGYVDVEGKSFRTVKKSGRYEDVIRECDKSLKRLRLDYLDLYFVHTPDRSTPFGETVEALTKLQDEGKIKEIGVSNVSLRELREYNQTGKIKYIQNRFSLLNQSIDRDYQEYLMKNKIGLIPYHVIDRGLLTDKVWGGIENLQHGDLRVGLFERNPAKLNLVAEWVKNQISPIAKRLGITVSQLSIAWALHQKYVSFVLVGLTNPEYITVNLEANDLKLPADVLDEIDSIYEKLNITNV